MRADGRGDARRVGGRRRRRVFFVSFLVSSRFVPRVREPSGVCLEPSHEIGGSRWRAQGAERPYASPRFAGFFLVGRLAIIRRARPFAQAPLDGGRRVKRREVGDGGRGHAVRLTPEMRRSRRRVRRVAVKRRQWNLSGHAESLARRLEFGAARRGNDAPERVEMRTGAFRSGFKFLRDRGGGGCVDSRMCRRGFGAAGRSPPLSRGYDPGVYRALHVRVRALSDQHAFFSDELAPALEAYPRLAAFVRVPVRRAETSRLARAVFPAPPANLRRGAAAALAWVAFFAPRAAGAGASRCFCGVSCTAVGSSAGGSSMATVSSAVPRMSSSDISGSSDSGSPAFFSSSRVLIISSRSCTSRRVASRVASCVIFTNASGSRDARANASGFCIEATNTGSSSSSSASARSLDISCAVSASRAISAAREASTDFRRSSGSRPPPRPAAKSRSRSPSSSP